MTRRLLPAVLLTAIASIPFIVFAAGGARGLIGVEDPDPEVPGDSDIYDLAWHFWWIGKAAELGVDPRACPLIGDDGPVSLVGHNLGWPDVVLFGRLLDLDPVSAENSALLFGTFLALAAGWLFARSWGLGGAPALIAAFIVAWSPPRAAHLMQHYPLASTGWLVLALTGVRLALVRGGWRYLALTAVAGSVAGLESAYHAIMLPVGAVVTAACSGRVGASRLMGAAAAVILCLACIYAFYSSFPGSMAVEMPRSESVIWAAEPVSLGFPSPFGLPGRLAGLSAVTRWMPNQFEGNVTPGLTVISLALIAFAGRRFRLLSIAALAVLVLAMGPELKFLGRPLGIPLPYRLLQELPLMGGARSPARFALLAGVLMAIPAASALERTRAPLLIPMALLVILELLPPGLPSIPATVPSFYSAGAHGGPVLEVPASTLVRRYSFFMTVDEQPRPVFFMARPTRELPPVFDPFLTRSVTEPDAEDAMRTGVETIIYNRWMFAGPERDSLDARFGSLFPGGSPDDSIWVWTR